ncbi:WD repeat-containing 74 [Chlorella sorokiniana]|uniref:WD repeat-containing 74 n=1 Tax=Chlorella sorokiniana TaxID=3076 RepID=A0A2P6TY23_CHLSO|nr:WD repeat-containing 74 [Chlorella sorokiniana]|eukprot:PRW58950.1 WD repeat-containing 74 [Chlorella sorokiniana]
MQEDERSPPVRLLYADELGQLKVVQTADGAQLGTAAVAASWGEPDKQQAIDCIALGSTGGVEDTATAVLAVARCSGAIELLSPLTGAPLGSIPPAAPAASGGSKQQQEDAVRVRGLHLIWGSDGAGNGSSSSGSSLPAVLSVTQSGTARVHTAAAAGQQPPDGGSAAPAAWEQQRSWQVPPQVCCTAYDPAIGRLAVGCEGAELRLFDAASGELVFTFKGGKPNKVGLVDKPWNTAIAFLPPTSTSSGGDGNGNAGNSGSRDAAGAAGTRLLVGTNYHKVRLYDSAAGKRPQMEMSWGEGRITALAVEPDGQRCWVGNGQGQLEVLDLGTRRFSGAIKGLAGSARALAVHPGGEVLASVCLDRYLRLHSCATRQLLAKVYCKTLPTGVAFCPTDASMLPPREQPAAGGEGVEERRRRKKDQKRERRRSHAAAEEAEEGSGDDGMAAAADQDSDDEQQIGSEEEAEEQQERRRPKRSKQHRSQGGGRRQQRRQ